MAEECKFNFRLFKPLMLGALVSLVMNFELYAQLPTFNFGTPTGNASGCAPHTVVFSISGVTSNPANTTYSLNFGDGSPVLNFSQSTIPNTISHTYTTISCGQTFNGQQNCFGATLTATNSNGPSAISIFPIRISKKPNASFTFSPTVICSGNNITFENTSDPGVTYNGANCNTNPPFYWQVFGPSTGTIISGSLGNNAGIPTDSDAWLTGSSFLSMQFNTPGSYQMKLSIGNSCGIDDTTLNFCVVAPPPTQFTINPTSGCAPPNLIVNATNTTVVQPNSCFPTSYSYNWSVSPSSGWSFNASNTASSFNSGFNFTSAGNYSISLSASVNNLPGCSTSTNQTLNLTQAPIVSAGPNQSICAGALAIQLAGSPTGGTWSGQGVSSSGLFTPPTTVASSTNYSLTYTVPAGICPAQSSQLTITVNPRPNVTVTPATPAICQGASVNLTAASNLPNTSFSWAPTTGLNTSSGSTVIASPITNTTYTVTATVSGTGCTNTEPINVIVHPNPTVNVPTPTAICAGQCATLIATGSGGLAPYTFIWSPGTGLSATTDANVSACPTVTTTYTVTITDSRGCTGQQQVTVNVNPIPVVNAGPDVPVCNSPIPYTLTGFSPGSGTWSGTGVTAGGVFTPSGVGSFTLTYLVTQNGCTGSDQIVLTVTNPTPANAGADQNICLNAPGINLTGTPSGGSWIGTGVSPSGLFTPSAVGTFVLTYSFGTGNCAVSDTKTITVLATPSVSVQNATICNGESTLLSAVGSGGSAPYTFSWSPSANLSSTSGAQVTATPTVTSTYTVTISDNNSCTSTAQAIVTVNAIPTVNAGPDIGICNTPIPYTLIGFSPGSGTWSGTGVTAGGVFTPSGVGSFTLTYSVTQNGCTGSDQIVLTVTNPTPANAGADQNICLNAPSINLTGTPSGGSWSGTGVIPGGLFTPSAVGTYTLTYNFGTDNCAVSDDILISVLELPSLSVLDVSYCIGSNATLQAQLTNGMGPYVFNWSPLAGLSSGSGASVIVDTTVSAVYTVSVTDANLCSDTQQVSVTVFSLPTVEAGDNLSVCNTPTTIQLLGSTPSNGLWTGSGITADGFFTPNTVGQFTMIYTYTDSNNCVNEDSLLLVVNDPEMVNAGSDTLVCLNSPAVQLNGEPTSGTWSGTTFLSSNGLFSPSETGQFELHYSIGTGSCAVVDTLIFTVNPLPVVEAGNDTSICINSLPFNFSGQSPNTGGTWIWSGIGITDNNNGIFDSNVSGSGFFNAFYTFTSDNNGCSNIDSLQVTVNDLTPVSVMTDSLSVCLTPFNTMLTATPSGGIWNGNGINFDLNLDAILDTAGFIPQNNGWFTAYYTFTDNNQCINSDTIHLNVVLPLDANAGADTSFCLSPLETAQLIGQPAGGFWTSLPNSSIISANGSFLLSESDTLSAIYSVGNGSCQTWDTCMVVIFPLPPISAGIDTFRCIDDPCFDLLPVFPNGGVWSGTGISNQQLGSFCASLAGEGNHVIYYQIDTTYFYQSLSATCSNIDSLNVLVVPMPSPDLIIEPVICINTDFQLGNNSSGPGAEFEWTILNANSMDTVFYSNEFSPVINLPQEGNYILNLLATSTYGCSVETSSLFIAVSPPNPDFSIVEDTVCAPYQVNLINASNGYQISYLWDFGQNYTQSSDTFPLVPIFTSPILNDTTYYIQLSLTNLCGTRTITDSVIVRPVPVAILGTNYSIACSPGTITLQNASYGSPTAYFWDFGNGITSSEFIPNPIDLLAENIPSQYLIQLTASNLCGADIDSAIVTILPSTFDIGELIPQNACIPYNFTFTAPAFDQTFYLWDFGDGNGGIGPDINHNYSIAGDYTLTLFISNFCLTDTVQTSISLGQGPELSISISENQICANSEVSVINLSQTGVDFQWYINGIPEANYSNTINIAGLENGLNEVQLTAINPTNGCLSSIQSNFEVFPRPVISISASPDTGCYPLSINILNQTIGANAWEWNFANSTGSSLQEPAIVINATGDFPIQLIAHNYVSFFLDCPDTASISVFVYPSPVSNFSLSALEGCGPPDTVFVTNQSTGVLENIWQWEQNLSNETAPAIVFSDTGLKWISLKVVNEFACADSSGKGYRVYGQPELVFSIEPEKGCPPLNVNFTNNTTYSDSVVWFFGDGSVSNLNSPSHIYNNSGNYTVSLNASTGNGLCTADTTLFQAIEVYPKAFSAFSVNPLSINQDSPVISLMNESSDYIALSFLIDSVFISQSLPSNYIFTDPDTGFHQLILVANNSFNCPDTSINNVYIKAKPQFYLPNSFSPNGDGINDRFKIYFERAPEVFWINIYNRWGQLIYSSTDPDEGWDGTFMNTGKNNVQDDVYVLKFSALIEGTLLNSRLFHNIIILR